MSVARENELEFKLELTHEELQRVRAHPALGTLAVGEPVTRTLRSIYFDTPDYRLRALGISFRLRSDGDRWLQTVKAGTGRRERRLASPFETEGAVERPEPDLRVIDDRNIRRKIEKAVEAVDPGAGVRDGRAAHDPAAARRRRRARAGPRRRRSCARALPRTPCAKPSWS